MGMFDTVLINATFLPVSEEDKLRLKDKTFQTKSLENSLSVYRITDDGTLETDWDTNFGKISKEESKNWEIVPITDAIKFYTSATDNGKWFEFIALFENGKLLNIKKIIGIQAAMNKYKGWL